MAQIGRDDLPDIPAAIITPLERQFPDLSAAAPDGLLAWGGNLEPPTLIAAYRRGIFPWFNRGDPILWWSPDPRCILIPAEFRLSTRSARKIRSLNFTFSLDAAFEEVIDGCSRAGRSDTWITDEMRHAYLRLHCLGVAHSVETWQAGELAGGLYGLALGRAFFGESMFHRCPEASRAALARLVAQLRDWDFQLIDCQQATPHMLRMGARLVPRGEFMNLLGAALSCANPCASNWQAGRQEISLQ